jgi:hypothetical protein
MTINILPVPEADYGLNPAVVDTVLWEKTYKLASDFIGDIVALTSKKGDFTPEILKKMGFTPYSTVK